MCPIWCSESTVIAPPRELSGSLCNAGARGLVMGTDVYNFITQWLISIPPSVAFKNYTFHLYSTSLCFSGSYYKQQLFPFTALNN